MDEIQVDEGESQSPMYNALVTFCRELIPRLEWEVDGDDAEPGHRMILVTLNNHQVTFRAVVPHRQTAEEISRACRGYALLLGDDYLLYDADEDEILEEMLVYPVYEENEDQAE